MTDTTGCDVDRWPLCCKTHKAEVHAEMKADAIEAARPEACHWMIEVASGNPEPDSFADTVMIIDCGATVTRLFENDSHGWKCESGHGGWEYGSPMQAAEEADEALAEYFGMGAD